MMAQSRAESTWDIYNYGKYINQFAPNRIKSIRQYQRINKKICRHKMSIMFNEICINEEMLPKYTHTHTHTHIYIYIYIYVCKEITGKIILNEPEFICSHTVKWFQILLSNFNNSI